MMIEMKREDRKRLVHFLIKYIAITSSLASFADQVVYTKDSNIRYAVFNSYIRMLRPSEVQNAISTLSSLSKDKHVPKAPVFWLLP